MSGSTMGLMVTLVNLSSRRNFWLEPAQHFAVGHAALVAAQRVEFGRGSADAERFQQMRGEADQFDVEHGAGRSDRFGAELMELAGTYAALLRRQMLEEDLESDALVPSAD